jgi:hypothetical protein
MRIRPVLPEDTEAINSIFTKHHKDAFGIPDKTITEAIVSEEDRVIAYGAVTLLAEAVMVLDLDASLREKDFALKQLIWQAIQGVSGKMDGLHAFVQDPEFAKVLKKHFGFKTCKGEALYLGI